jgi:hypothetical protein
MKKGRPQRPPKISTPKEIDSESSLSRRRGVFIALFFLVLLFSVGLKIYKADHAGIIFDERANFALFGGSLDRALNVFTTTNNHVLNSVSMYYAHKYFSSYEHFIRIPSLLTGIMFSLSMAYIIYKTIRSHMLKVCGLALVSLVPFVFNYSFLARGYSFALAGIFIEIAFVLWLFDHKIRFRYWPIPVVVISLMNFLAFGAMLSSILLLVAFNITFALLYSPKVFRNAPSKLIVIVVNLVGIFMVSFVLLFGLYRNIYKDILNNPVLKEVSTRMRGWPSFTGYLHNILIRKVFRLNSTFATVILYAVVCLLIMAVVFHLYRFFKAVKAHRRQEYLKAAEPGPFLFIIAGLTIIFMYIQCVIMKKGLGLDRSHVFLIPLVLICGTMLLDRFISGLGPKKLRLLLHGFAASILIIVTVRNLPAPYGISSSTISGPLLRKLKVIDPNKTWNIAFTEKMKNHNVGFWYYKQFDYKYNLLTKKVENYDVLVCKKDEVPPRAVYLDWEYFNNANCAVIINCPLPSDRVVVQARLKED